MDQSFKHALWVSAGFHILVLVAAPVSRPKVITIPLNIDLVSLPKSAASAEDAQKKTPPPEPKKEDVISKKKISEKKAKTPEKKEQPKLHVKTEQQLNKTVPREQLPIQGPSSRVTLEDTNFPFTYYLKILQQKIAANWEWPQGGGVLKTVVYFRISRTGAFADIRLKEPSGDRLFDQAALRATQLAAPMVPLPDAYTEQHLGVFFEFSYRE